jgi:pSer/pThr/pTyr-binding forkhead associated (FHA) protein
MNDEEPTMLGQGRPAANLVIRQGTQAGMSFPITGAQAIIGREEGLDIVLQDPEASRRHTRISWQGGRYVAEDMGSTNGTFINGVQITAPQVLNLGDSIGIGQTAMVFQMVGGQPADVMPGGFAQQPPSYSPQVVGQSTETNKTTQYLLYGCGCLLLLSICFLLGIVVWALVFTESFEGFTGLKITLHLLQTYLNAV